MSHAQIHNHENLLGGTTSNKEVNMVRLKLFEEKKKNAEARQLILRLRKKLVYEKKYKSLKSDYAALKTQFETSETMRQD